MAVEVILGDYRFQLDTATYATSSLKKFQEGHLDGDFAPPTFSHNALHDLESLWWVCVWELMFYRNTSWAPMATENIESRKDTMYKLFPRTTEINHRLNFLDDVDTFFQMLHWMPKDYDDFVLRLDVIRAQLVLRYENFDRTMNFSMLSGLHDIFVSVLRGMIGPAQNRRIELKPYKWTTGRAEPEEKGEPTASSLGKRRLEDDEFLVPHPRQDVDM